MRGASWGRRAVRSGGRRREAVRSKASGELARAVVGLAGVSASTAALVLTDPSKRRQEGIDAAGGNEKQAVKSYFEEDGFQRWSRIYSDAAEVSKARRLNRSICPEACLKAFGRLAEQDANHRCQRYSATLLTMQDSLVRSMKRDSVDMLMSLALRNAHQCCRSYSCGPKLFLWLCQTFTPIATSSSGHYHFLDSNVSQTPCCFARCAGKLDRSSAMFENPAALLM